MVDQPLAAALYSKEGVISQPLLTPNPFTNKQTVELFVITNKKIKNGPIDHLPVATVSKNEINGMIATGIFESILGLAAIAAAVYGEVDTVHRFAQFKDVIPMVTVAMTAVLIGGVYMTIDGLSPLERLKPALDLLNRFKAEQGNFFHINQNQIKSATIADENPPTSS